MAKVEAGRSIIRLSYLLAAVAALAVVVLAAVTEQQGRAVHRQEERGDAADALNVVRAQLQGALDGHVQLIEGVVGIVEYQPDITPEDFERLAAGG